jgi:hypothetical protein
MARKKQEALDQAPPPVESTLPVATTAVTTTCPSESPPSDTNGNGERKPAKVFSYLVSRDTYVQASIWERVVKVTDGSEFLTHDVTLRKRYRDVKDGDWKTLYSFRGSEIYAVLHGLAQASSWILEARANATSCPF